VYLNLMKQLLTLPDLTILIRIHTVDLPNPNETAVKGALQLLINRYG